MSVRVVLRWRPIIMRVIGTGVGRTGTYSLKLALAKLGLGPCHHMEEVLHNMPVQVPLWRQAVDGEPDWTAIYEGYQSAVDWPTACFFRELLAAYPSAKFILTHRSPETWADSFSSTIYKLLAGKDQMPPETHDWLAMAEDVIAKTGFPPGLSREQLIERFVAHNEAVKATIPGGATAGLRSEAGLGAGLRLPGSPRPRRAVPAHERPGGILGSSLRQSLGLLVASHLQ